MMQDRDIEKEFLGLFFSYYRAVLVSDMLLANKVFEQKIKINFTTGGNEPVEIYNHIVGAIAEVERRFDNRPDDNIDGGHRSVIADCYFTDLKEKGSEWRFAYLEQKFLEQRDLARDQIQSDNEDY